MSKHGCKSCKCEERAFITIKRGMSIEDRMKVMPALGSILEVDMGKRVYFFNDRPQVESMTQFKNRMEQENVKI